MVRQQTGFTKHSVVSASDIEVSYAVGTIIAQPLKTFSDAEFVRDCLLTIAAIVCP